MRFTVADPDLELRGGGPGLDLLAMAAIFPSVISSLFTVAPKPMIPGFGCSKAGKRYPADKSLSNG